DYLSQDFSTAYVYAPQAITGDPSLRANSRLSVGLERMPNVAGEFGTSFGLDRWALRLGFTYGVLPVASAVSGQVTELALSAGFGIPVSYETLLNLSVIGGQHVPANTSTAPKENFIR